MAQQRKKQFQHWLSELFKKVQRFSLSIVKMLTQRYLLVFLAIATTLCVVISPTLATSPTSPSPTPSSTPSTPSLLDQGRTLYEAGQVEQAAEIWKRAAIEYARTGDRLNEIRSYINQAQALKVLGAYREAIVILEAQNLRVEPDSLEKVQILRSLGESYLATGKPDDAKKTLQLAIDALQKVKVDSESLRQEQSNLYLSFGLIERSEINRLSVSDSDLGDNGTLDIPLARALKLQEQSKKTSETLQQAIAPDPTSLAAVQARLNQISLLVSGIPEYNNVLATSLADTSEVLAAFSQLPASFVKGFLNDPTLPVPKSSPTEKKDGYLQKYAALNTLKQQTVQFTDELLSLMAQVRDSIDRLPLTRSAIDARINYAQSLSKLKLVSTSTNNVTRQLTTLRQEIRLAQAKQPAKPPVTQARTKKAKPLPPPFLPDQLQKGLQQAVSTSYEDAVAVLTKAIADAQTLKNQRAKAYALAALAELYGQPQPGQTTDKAYWAGVESLCKRALVAAQASNSPEIGYRLQRLMGRALKEQGNLQAARSAYRLAARTLQSIRGDLVGTNQDLQYDFRDSVEPVYREAVEVLLPAPGESPNQTDLEEARQFIESLQLAELDNFLREACIQGRKIALDQVVDRDNPTTAVIYPIILPQNRLGVIAKIPGQKELRYNPFENVDVESTLVALRQGLSDSSIEDLWKPSAETVYSWLIAPFRSDLKQSKVNTIVFVPDGTFRVVPMSALYDGQNNQFLVQEYAIAVSQGLQLFDPKALAQTQLKVLAAGKSNFSNPQLTERLAALNRGRSFSNLDAVKQELEDIKSRVNAQVLYETNFTSQALRANISANPFNVVHVATHGVFGDRKEQTYIIADDGPINVDELSDILRSRDRNGGTSIELLVLSACETAEGNNRVTLGLSGIAVRAGARSAIGSLWTVEDKSTSKLMDVLYDELANAKNTKITKAQALQRAQRSLIDSSTYQQHPAYWAPFVLVGNWL